MKDNGLCKEILESKYGFWRNMNDKDNITHQSRWRNDLRSVWENGANTKWFDENVVWKFRTHSKISFQNVRCFGDSPLMYSL